MRRSVLLLAAAVAACSSRSSPTVSSTRAAVESNPDNTWYLSVQASCQKVFNPLTAPQATPVDGFLAQSRAAFASACPEGVRGAVLILSLTPTNVWAPPPPDHAYSPSVVKHFVGGVDQLMSFLPQAGLDARSYRQSLAATSQTLADVLDTVQNAPRKFSQRKQEIIDADSQRIRDAAAPVLGQEMTELTGVKQNTKMVQQIVGDYTSAVAGWTDAYTVAVKSYQAYRALENDAIQKLTQIATASASADLDAIGQLGLQLHDLGDNESQLADQLQIVVGRIARPLAQIEEIFSQRIAPYVDFMSARNIARPDATTVALRSLAAMNDYCAGRGDRVSKAVEQIHEGLSRRTTALLVQAVDTATQPTLLAAAQLAASANFVGEINDRLSHLWQSLPKSTNLQLSFLSAKYDEMVSFLGLEPMCASSPPAYAETGCKLLKPQFSRAHDWINRTAPSVIRIQAMMMSSKGVDSTKTAAIVAEVNAGQVRQAAFDQDVLLGATDVPPPTPDGGSPTPDGGDDSEDE